MTDDVFVSYFIRPNRREESCSVCGGLVPIGHGFSQKDRDGKWWTFCMRCTYAKARFVPQIADDGSLITGIGLANRSARWTLGTCTKCGDIIGLVQSKKSGKWYFADTRRKQAGDDGPSDVRRVGEWMPHKCGGTT